MTIVELRKALTRFKQTHNKLPAEPLHFTLDQWREFLLEERLKVIEVCTPDMSRVSARVSRSEASCPR